MSSAGTGKIKNLEANIVIIGGGGAGLAAAVAAAEKGASDIIVLERRGLGGNSALAAGIFAAESPVQKRVMIDCRRDDCFKLVMDFTHWRVNPRIIRAFIDKSGDTIRWFEEKGLEFKCMPLFPNQAPLTWHMPKGYGAEIVKVLTDECRKLGVEILTRTPAKKILLGPNGEVTGVLAEREGKQFTITTSRVIIATGGLGDKSFNDISYAGVKRAEEELGIDFDYVEPAAIAEYEVYQRDFAKTGDYEIIICIGFDQMDALTVVAAEYPNPNFVLVDEIVNETNVASLLFKTKESSFLIGFFQKFYETLSFMLR